ncbi:conserved Plasmodium protein, unknown function [Plasmodium ovale wallikeri]|uniref:Uncharacterized protein n=1 Tax=Plasmodium ovale wallikeri TaxID=864142 RepID=A0A1A8YU99_PLAOA|nr:conserved Plasmodium protein, unknown function [Plasmodium ovale wallikeri]SBT35119.1 conserved Plasmodium protein, unknown function [Plasmodium ovale wallikeri]
MAFMFKREGCYSKNRLSELFRKNKSFVNQLMYDLTSFHYENYMQGKIHKNIMNNYNALHVLHALACLRLPPPHLTTSRREHLPPICRY